MTLSLISISDQFVLFVDHQTVFMTLLKKKEPVLQETMDITDIRTGKFASLFLAFPHVPVIMYIHQLQCRYTPVAKEDVSGGTWIGFPLILWRQHYKDIFGLRRDKESICVVYPEFNAFQQLVLDELKRVVTAVIHCRQWTVAMADCLADKESPWSILPVTTPVGIPLLIVLKKGMPVFSRPYQVGLLTQELVPTTAYLKRYGFEASDQLSIIEKDSPLLWHLPKGIELHIPTLWTQNLLYRWCRRLTFLVGMSCLMSLGLAVWIYWEGTNFSHKISGIQQDMPVVDKQSLTEDPHLLDTYLSYINGAFPTQDVIGVLKKQLPKSMVVVGLEWSEKEALIKVIIDPALASKEQVIQETVATCQGQLPFLTVTTTYNDEESLLTLSVSR